ncbi:zinc finger protein 853-like [Colias croceus]|uniref:zinc finger protein 853-like n=1 Tax=Colias crocea TaxID=72248 RepID=UPI001E27EAFB|nr:zinc finger protein 853-like [Colias croceus]
MYRVFVLLCTFHLSHGFFCYSLQVQVGQLQQGITTMESHLLSKRAYYEQLLAEAQQNANDTSQNAQTQINQCHELKNQQAASHQQQEQQLNQQITQLQAKLAEQQGAAQTGMQCQQQLGALQQQVNTLQAKEQELKKQIEEQQRKLLEQEQNAKLQHDKCQQQLQQQIALQKELENKMKDQEQQSQKNCADAQENITQTERAKCQQELQKQLDLQKQQENTTKQREQELQKLRERVLELEKSLSSNKMPRSKTFDYLGSFLNELDFLQCNIDVSTTVAQDSYKLTYRLPKKLNDDDIEVKINNRVIYVKGSEGSTVLFESVELLPAGLNVKSTDWQLRGDNIMEIIIPFNLSETGNKIKSCIADNPAITIESPESTLTFRNKP